MNYKGYMFIPGNKTRGIGYKIYGLGSNFRWPDGNSVDRLLLVGQSIIDKPSGYDWGWEGTIYDTAEKAVEAAINVDDDASLYLHYDAEEFESYVRSFANNKTQFEKADQVCWHSDYGYFFRWWNTPMQGYMTCDFNRLVMWDNPRSRTVRYMFRW